MPRSTENKSAQMLPKILPSAVCAQFKKCGRPGCKCARGLLHGPYFYNFYREAGKLKKSYIRSSDVANVRKLCEAGRRERANERETMQDWRQLLATVREFEGVIQGGSH